MKTAFKITSERSFEQKRSQLLDLMDRFTQPSAEDSPAEVSQRRIAYQHDFLGFAKYYFRHYCTLDFGPIHDEIELIVTEYDGEFIVFAAPRGFSKSVMLSTIYPIWEAVYERRRFIVLFSRTDDLAEDICSFITFEFSENLRLRQDFGSLLDGNYAVSDFTLRNDVHFKSRGWRTSLRGLRYRQNRPDLFILDDMETDESAESPEQCAKLLNWTLKALYFAGSIERPCKKIWIGTVIKHDCVIGTLLGDEFKGKFIQINLRALRDDHTSLWPAMISVEALEALREKLGTVAFESEMQNDPIDENGLFRPEWLKYYDIEDIQGAALIKALAVDPSVTDNAGSDYKAIVVMGMDTNNATRPVFYVLDAWIRKCSLGEMYDKIIELYLYHRPNSVVFESNGFQRVCKTEIDRIQIDRRISFPIKLIEHQANKTIRIKRLSVYWEHGQFKFQKGQGDQKLMADQFLKFPNSRFKDDGPDAGEMAVAEVEEYGSAPQSGFAAITSNIMPAGVGRR